MNTVAEYFLQASILGLVVCALMYVLLFVYLPKAINSPWMRVLLLIIVLAIYAGVHLLGGYIIDSRIIGWGPSIFVVIGPWYFPLHIMIVWGTINFLILEKKNKEAKKLLGKNSSIKDKRLGEIKSPILNVAVALSAGWFFINFRRLINSISAVLSPTYIKSEDLTFIISFVCPFAAMAIIHFVLFEVDRFLQRRKNRV